MLKALVFIVFPAMALFADNGISGPAPTNAVPPASRPASIHSTTALDNHHQLGPGDRVNYRVIEDQDDPVSLTINDSGELPVPYIGLVPAAGKTSLALAKDVKRLLERQHYYRATVIIAVEVVNKARVTGKVYVTGYVRNPGGFDIPAGESFTVSKAILKAGGFSDFSDKRRVRVIRATGSDKASKTSFFVNVQEIWDKGKLENDLQIRPDDTVVVSGRLVNF